MVGARLCTTLILVVSPQTEYNGKVVSGFLENVKQRFLTSETQVVIAHFILEAPVSKARLLRGN